MSAFQLASHGCSRFLRSALARGNSVRGRIGVTLIVGLAVLVAALPLQAQQRPKLPTDEQLRVNLSIQQGYKYLLRRQQADGSFPGPGHPVGVTSLAALAL